MCIYETMNYFVWQSQKNAGLIFSRFSLFIQELVKIESRCKTGILWNYFLELILLLILLLRSECFLFFLLSRFWRILYIFL